jgi:hypothetical protein
MMLQMKQDNKNREEDRRQEEQKREQDVRREEWMKISEEVEINLSCRCSSSWLLELVLVHFKI